jgi:hypothetical protein
MMTGKLWIGKDVEGTGRDLKIDDLLTVDTQWRVQS